MTELTTITEEEIATEAGSLIEAPYDPLAFLPPELRARVEEAQKQIHESSVVSGKKISPRAKVGNQYRFPNGDFHKKFTGIIVASHHFNKHYANPYDENNMQPPDCMAGFRDRDASNAELLPLAEIPTPYGTDCKTCPKYQWKSSVNGRGRACAEYILLALYVPALGNELVLMEQKKARAQQMDRYLRQHSTSVCPLPMLVQTEFEIGIDDDPWEQSFTAVGNTSQDLVASLVPRIEEAESLIWGAIERDLTELRKLSAATSEEEPTPAAQRQARRK